MSSLAEIFVEFFCRHRDRDIRRRQRDKAGHLDAVECRAGSPDIIRHARGGDHRAAALRPAVDQRLFAGAGFLQGAGGADRIDRVARLRHRDHVLVPAAAAETLIVGGDQHVAASDEFFRGGHAVIRPRIAAEQKILVQGLRRIGHLGGPAILRRPGGAVRPGHDRTPLQRRLPGRRDHQRRDHGFAVGDVGSDIGDAPRLCAGDRGRHFFLLDDVAQFSVGNDFGRGLIERRQRHGGQRRRRRK